MTGRPFSVAIMLASMVALVTLLSTARWGAPVMPSREGSSATGPAGPSESLGLSPGMTTIVRVEGESDEVGYDNGDHDISGHDTSDHEGTGVDLLSDGPWLFVRDLGGTPIARATVTWWSRESASWAEIHQEATDENGRTDASPSLGDEIAVSVVARGYVTTWIPVDEELGSGRDFVVSLAAASAFRIRLVRPEGGPDNEAAFVIRPEFTLFPEDCPLRFRLPTPRADGPGVFLADELPPGNYRIGLRKGQFLLRDVIREARSGEEVAVELVVNDPLRVPGRVFEGEALRGGGRVQALGRYETVSARGEFTLHLPGPGQYTIFYFPPGGRPVRFEAWIEEGQPLDLRYSLVDFEGLIRLPDGFPFPRARVHLLQRGFGPVMTDVEGRFRIEGLPTGRHRLRLLAPPSGVLAPTWDIDVSSRTPSAVFDLRATTPLEVHVDAAELPPTLVVRALPPDEKPQTLPVRRHGESVFFVDWPEGCRRGEVSAPGWPPVALTVDDPTAPASVRLLPGGWLAVSVRNSHGRVIREHPFSIAPQGPDLSPEMSGHTESSERRLLLLPGSYRVTLPGGDTAARVVTVQEGETVRVQF